MRLAICSIVACVGFTSAFACTPVSDFRIDPQKRAQADAGASDKWTPRAERDAAADSDKPATMTGKAGSGGKGAAAAAGKNSQPKAGSEAKAGSSAPSKAPTANSAGEAAATPDTSAPAETPAVAASEAREQAGWAALTDWQALPVFASAATQLFSTHERGSGASYPLIDPGNKDFNSFLGICGDHPELVGQQNDANVTCSEGQTGYLVAADDGPGYVSRMLLARGISNPSSSVLVELRPMNERVRVYIDGQPKPVIDSLWSELADAKSAPFDAPLTGWTSGGTISYLPISYSNRLRVFVDDLNASSTLTLYYVHVTTQRVAATKPYNAEVLASAAAKKELDQVVAAAASAGSSWFDQDVTLDGASRAMSWTRDRAGTLQRIELQLDAASAAETLNETKLRLRWDDDAPAVDLPLAAMFGSRNGVTPASVSTLPLNVKNDGTHVTMTLSLPMPFANSAKLELLHTGESARTIKLRLYGTDTIPRGEWGHFHGALSEHREPQRGERFRAAALSGRGKYLGTILYVHGKADGSGQVRASELGFLEGDERLDVDGQSVWLGTGTDNYFNAGFYFKDGVFNSPFAAVSQLDDNTSAATSAVTLMRWTVLTDEINFQKQLELSFEIGANRPATASDYAAVSFYYQ